MKKLGLLVLSSVFVSSSVFADGKNEQNQAAVSNETVTRVVVEMNGKPPYKRYTETVRVTDIAALEEADNASSQRSAKRIR